MPRISRLLRRDPIAIAMTAYQIWRRLPPRQRKQALKLVRKHGPKLAAKAMNAKKR
jgi:hypothetical protein